MQSVFVFIESHTLVWRHEFSDEWQHKHIRAGNTVGFVIGRDVGERALSGASG